MTTEFLIIGLFLLCAKLLEGVASRFKQSSLLAYLVVGIILGIWFEPGEESKLFFEVGVLFLFFLIGIDEIDISGFVGTLRGRFFVAAFVSFAVPFAANLMVFLYLLELSGAQRRHPCVPHGAFKPGNSRQGFGRPGTAEGAGRAGNFYNGGDGGDCRFAGCRFCPWKSRHIRVGWGVGI